MARRCANYGSVLRNRSILSCSRWCGCRMGFLLFGIYCLISRPRSLVQLLASDGAKLEQEERRRDQGRKKIKQLHAAMGTGFCDAAGLRPTPGSALRQDLNDRPRLVLSALHA